MGFLGLKKNVRRPAGPQLFLKINANRAADLVPSTEQRSEAPISLTASTNAARAATDSLPTASTNDPHYHKKKPANHDSTKRKKSVNPVLIASLNNTKRSSTKKLHTTHPSWDDSVFIPLQVCDYSQILVLTVWDKHRAYKNYLGELRLCINEIFCKDGYQQATSDLKWYKLYSSRSQLGYVVGSVLLSFEIIVRERKRDRKERERMQRQQHTEGKKRTANSAATDAKGAVATSAANSNSNSCISVNSAANSADSGNSNSAANAKGAVEDLFNKIDSITLNDDEFVPVDRTDSEVCELLESWIASLIVPVPDPKLYKPDDQGFYVDANSVSLPHISDTESIAPSTEPQVITIEPATETTTPSVDVGGSIFEISGAGSEDSASVLSADLLDLSAGEGSVSHLHLPTQATANVLSSHLAPGTKTKKPADFRFEVGNQKKILGVIFLEIISCSDLPPMKNVTRTSFDMDPFVVVTFGKRTFRTSWKRHTLNPIFNERLAFEILSHELNYDVQFAILDRDHFSFHDKVANKSLPMKEITELSTEYIKRADLENVEFQLGLPTLETLDYPSTTLHNIKIAEDDPNLVCQVKKKRFTKRKKVTVQYADTSKFKTMDLVLDLHDLKYKGKYNPMLKIRARFEPYEQLRRQFWKTLLEQYQFSEDEDCNIKYDYIELIALLDTLGCEDSDDIVQGFFQENSNKLIWGGDTLTIDEICDLLERYISRKNNTSKIFEIEKCPICFKKRFNKKSGQDLDFITHFAICASKDWSIVNKLLLLSYATPQVATRRWFSKVLIKISYGKYKLGSNSANILVQDRLTGIIMEEKMGVYVRLGIRLLYKGLDLARTKRIRQLLKKLSVKQGKKFDLPALKNDIGSFIKFHSLDLTECLEQDPLKYATFNEFFYRKLKPGARPISLPEEDRIVVSPADCRCTVYNSVNDATEFWVKGRNFTLAKLFNGNYSDIQDTSPLFKASECAMGIFRLAPQDYHRFHSPVTGTVNSIRHIDGEYYTVNPMAIRSELDVFGENIRTLISIETEDFGTIIMVAVGAMMVGSTVLSIEEGDKLRRGDEVGYFKFGGSTILLLFESKKFKFDADIVSNSMSSVETLIRVGQSVGHHPEVEECSINHIDFAKQSKDFKLNLIRVLTGGDLDTAAELSNWEALRMDYSEVDEVLVDKTSTKEASEGKEDDDDEDDDSFDSEDEEDEHEEGY